MPSNSAPGADRTTIISSSSSPSSPDSGDDPIRLLLGGPPDPGRHFALRHWLGVSGLVGAIAVAAFVMPPLLTPEAQPPPAAAPLWSGVPSPVSLAPTATVPGSKPTTTTDSPATSTRPGAIATPTKPKTPGHTVEPAAADPPAAPGESATKAPSITVQAEDATLSGGAAAVDCGTCEAGARVRFVGRVDVHATIPTDGTYDLRVVYEVEGSRTLDVSVDGGPPIATRQVTGADWTTPLILTVRATLSAGPIDIGLYGDAGNAPDIDAVTIS